MQTVAGPPVEAGSAAATPSIEMGAVRASPWSRYGLALIGLGIFLATGALYTYTLSPSVMPGDYAEFQMAAAVLGVPHPTGYPLYVLLGKLFTMLPFGDVAYRVNFSSAVYMAGAAAVLYAITLRLTRFSLGKAYPWAAVLGAIFFALAPTVWSMALVARSYALNALLVSLVAFSLISWRRIGRALWFYLSCLFIGLSLVHHGTTYLLLPAYGLFLLLVEYERRRRGDDPRPWQRRLIGTGAFLLGYSPILFLVYRFVDGSPYYWGNPQTWEDFFNLLGGGPFQNQVMAFGWGAQLDRLAFGIGQLSDQYTPIGIAAGLLGVVLLWRYAKAEAGLLTLMMLGNFLFAMNYSLVGYLYFIPTYLIWGVLIGVAATWLCAKAVELFGGVSASRRQVIAAGTAVAALLIVLPLAANAMAVRYPNISLRGHTEVRDNALALLNSAPQGASLYLDWEDISVLRFYRLVYGMRPDITMHTGDPADWAKWAYCDITNGIPAYVGKFAGAEPPVIARDFSTEPAPIGWRVVSVNNAGLYEVPACGACATCR